MRKIDYTKVLILSAELDTNTFKGNEDRTRHLKTSMDELDIHYTQGVGVYKGSVETSFVVTPRCPVEHELVLAMAFKTFNQESVLFQDNDGESYLIFNGEEGLEHIGKLRELPKILARKQDSYTVLNDKYYAIA